MMQDRGLERLHEREGERDYREERRQQESERERGCYVRKGFEEEKSSQEKGERETNREIE